MSIGWNLIGGNHISVKTGEGEERFVPHGIRHLKLSKRQDSDLLSGSGPTFWSALLKGSDSDTDSAVSFNRSTAVSNPDDYIFVQKAKAFGVPSSCRGLIRLRSKASHQLHLTTCASQKYREHSKQCLAAALEQPSVRCDYSLWIQAPTRLAAMISTRPTMLSTSKA